MLESVKVALTAAILPVSIVAVLRWTQSSKGTVPIEVVVQERADSYPVRAVKVEFGIMDQEPTRWDGSVSISDGGPRGHVGGKIPATRLRLEGLGEGL